MSSITNFGGTSTNQKTIIGHPVGLFILFFTEMWERFSYYGMRGILVLFLTSSLLDGGFGWERGEALVLYGWYTGLVYLTPIIGGWFADKIAGFRNSVTIGAFLMTLGHASLAGETTFTFYLGLGLLIIGTGFFKPNIASIVGQMYPDGSELKDSAYTIFYMGVNAGAFLGILICGWLGETKGWSYGFGAAGIFMFFGMLQFWFGQKIFGKIGVLPSHDKSDDVKNQDFEETKVPFTSTDRTFFIVSLVLGLATIILWQVYTFESFWMQYGSVLPFVITLLYFFIQRLKKYPTKERERLTVIAVLAFFTIFFWVAFEQAGGTMSLFARDYTQRGLSGATAVFAFQIISLLLTLIPIIILTWVLVMLGIKIFKEYPLTILFTAISFLTVWGIIYLINYENFTEKSLEVPASWFGTLNSFFIISFAPVFSTLWFKLSKVNRNPSGPVKFALGLFLLGIGFGALVIGASSIPKGAETASVSMIWLVLAYFFHTIGELCLSPVGMSFVNKLSPKRLVGLMFGVWYLANFAANFLAGIIGSLMDDISQNSSLSGFFLIFVISPFAAGALLLFLNKPLKRMMHGVK